MMATSSNDTQSLGSPSCGVFSDLLMCPVCLETFREPRTLNCLHSFCCKCLEQCRRGYRRELACPVCKKITLLPSNGIQGLQHDFRIQQIRDILSSNIASRPASPPTSPLQSEDEQPSLSKFCDMCKSQQQRTMAEHHCVQCCIYFCKQCLDKHNRNTLFTSHSVVSMLNSTTSEALFCKTHREYVVRYFCKICALMLCTICTMDHNSEHNPVALDKSVTDRYQQELADALRIVHAKMLEVRNRTKYLEVIKQTHQRALYEAQKSIKDKANDVIKEIREQEKRLIQELQQQTETRTRQSGLETLSDINFHMNAMETLKHEIEKVITGSQQQCLVKYDDLMNKIKSVSEFKLPPKPTQRDAIMKFYSGEDLIPGVLGKLQDCNLMEDGGYEELTPNSPPPASPRSPHSPGSPHSPPPGGPMPGMPKSPRLYSILGALASTRPKEMKKSKIKGYFPPLSPNNSINADELVGAASGGSTSMDDSEAGPSTSSPTGTIVSPAGHGDVPPLSPIHSPYSDDTPAFLANPQLIITIDQVGGWPGRIMSPSGVDFLPNGHIVIAESDNRLQVFDRNGQSQRIIAWGKVSPVGVAVTREGHIAVTDKRDKCVKVFTSDGDVVTTWGIGIFSSPSGIAVSSQGKFIIADVDKHAVSVHNSDGNLLLQFGTWGSGDYQFSSPSYVTVNKFDDIIVSDLCNGKIKVYDHAGKYKLSFSLSPGTSAGNTHAHRPRGICCDQFGNILVADRDNHRISMYTTQGSFIRHVLMRPDIKFPWDLRVSNDGHIVLVETHNGFLSRDPHHAIKMFKVFAI